MQKHLWAGDRRLEVKVPECVMTKVCTEILRDLVMVLQ